MTRRLVVRLPTDGPRFFEVVSYGRAGAQMPPRFSRAQIDQISRTVRRTPEVMVKVTGGGTRRGAVAAHFAYLSRQGTLEIETDEGERIGRREEHKRLLDDWHLELTAGQYRRQKDGAARRPTRLVHNIVLSMPRPTPPDKVLAAARQFARKRFAEHRYAVVLHTHQQHPHEHLVVKAESELGRRLHIDKQLLRDWREDFAQLMREQGIAANATPRAIRGENKTRRRAGIFKAQFYGKSKSAVIRERVRVIATDMWRSGTIEDPARERLLETRKSLVSTWMKAAEVLDEQGEEILAGDVRYFAMHLPPVLTDRQHLAVQLILFKEQQRRIKLEGPERVHPRVLERTAAEWRDEQGLTWLEYAPKIKLIPVKDGRAPYPLARDEQAMLFQELPDHLARMALFKVNTGCRDREVCSLKWDDEVKVPELRTSVFIIPGDRVKNAQDRLVVLNRIARSVVEAQRGQHPEYVFTFVPKRGKAKPGEHQEVPTQCLCSG